VRPLLPELRYNPLFGTWAIHAPDRARRPAELLLTSGVRADLPCPFCPGHEGSTGRTIYQIPQHGPWETRVVANLFPALRVEEQPARRAHGPWGGSGGTGAHEVVIETRGHSSSQVGRSAAEGARVLAAWRERVRDLACDERLRYVSVFRNHGALAGATLDHPHSQILATPHVPARIIGCIERSRAWYALHGRSLMGDVIASAVDGAELCVARRPRAVAFCPWASEYPFEVWIAPYRPCGLITEWCDATLTDIADLARTVLVAQEGLLNQPAYNLTVLQSPLRTLPSEDPPVHAFLRITPILHPSGGYELLAGERINPTLPEVAANAMREMLS
jgi:UDPglucose--hexose-1-phosphate uridylyltransferase